MKKPRWYGVWGFVGSLFVASSVWGQVTLELPVEGATLSGIGLISGWACEGRAIAVSFDGTAQQVPILYGASRGDTRSVCGDANNGFALLFNWNILGEGEHTVYISVDGRVRVSRSITVVTYGREFLRGAEGEWTLEDWPRAGMDTVVAWNEAQQNVEIVDILRSHTPQPPTSTQDVRAILGTWRFTTDIAGEMYTDEGTLHTLYRDEAGHLLARGQTSWGAFMIGGLIRDTIPTYSGPYLFFTFWLSDQFCETLIFSLTSATTAEGLYSAAARQGEECGESFGEYPATGVRIRPPS